MKNKVIKLDPPTPKRHPKCKGYWTYSCDGNEFDCEYETILSCDECKYGVGRKDPDARCNAIPGTLFED